MFVDLLGKSREVCVENMLVKSLQGEQHIQHLEKTFQVLSKYQMRLDPTKCVFGVASGKFLGFMVYNQGIEANIEKFYPC